MRKCKPINSFIDCRNKLSKYDEGEKIDLTLFKSLVASLQDQIFLFFFLELVCKPLHGDLPQYIEGRKNIFHQ